MNMHETTWAVVNGELRFVPLIQDKDYILFFSSKILLESVLDEFGDEGAMFSSATKTHSDFAKILNLPLFSKAIVAASIKL